jgi:GH24 family phage-related lysozyme (muramidase)
MRCVQSRQKSVNCVTKLSVKLSDLFRYYKALPHQMAAIVELETELLKAAPDVFNRDRPWFKTWSTAGKQQDHSAAISLIKEFEGCHLTAYKCPAGVWTIGWGTTAGIKQGDTITQEQADQLLTHEIDRIVERLRAVPHWNEMAPNQQSALISFAYNLGAGFYGAKGFETISARLRNKDWTRVPEAMLLYRNPGSSFEAGLRRRRIAEGNLWAKGLPQVQQDVAKLSPQAPFTARITPHIQLGEFALFQEARRFQHQYQLDTAAELAAFLERARVKFGGKPVVISSGFRPRAINSAVGGSSGSEHLYDAPGVGAVDFYIREVNINHVQDWCDANWPYSLGYGAPKGFVHLGIRRGRPRVRWDY